ncbi:MAG: hypothetical protein U0V64_09855 [Cyclobacteriaceae bacterium]
MKIASRILFLAFAIALTGLSSCKKGSDPAPDPAAEQLKKLSKTWKVSTVTQGGTDVTASYTAFTLTVSGTAGAASFGYVTTNRPALSPWPSSGSWNFGTTIATDIVRDKATADELPITYSVSDTQLQLSFTFNGNGYQGSRVNNVGGNWIFTLTPQ